MTRKNSGGTDDKNDAGDVTCHYTDGVTVIAMYSGNGNADVDATDLPFVHF